jgi:hypothetical protein
MVAIGLELESRLIGSGAALERSSAVPSSEHDAGPQ